MPKLVLTLFVILVFLLPSNLQSQAQEPEFGNQNPVRLEDPPPRVNLNGNNIDFDRINIEGLRERLGGIVNQNVVLHLNAEPIQPGGHIKIEVRSTNSVHLESVFIFFNINQEHFDLVDIEIEGTSSSHIPKPSMIVSKETLHPSSEIQDSWSFGCSFQPSPDLFDPLPPGENQLLFKGILKVRSTTPSGMYTLQDLAATSLERISESQTGKLTVSFSDSSITEVEVLPPTGPRPIDFLSCETQEGKVNLSWKNSQNNYDAIDIVRDGELIESLSPDSTTFEEAPAAGLRTYQIYSRIGDTRSIESTCTLLVDIPRPPRPENFKCSVVQSNHLTWDNPIEYQTISVFRNGKIIDQIDGKSTEYSDPFTSSLFTIYSLKGIVGEVGSLASNCKLNEFSNRQVFKTENIRTVPGAKNVPIRFYGTNTVNASALSFGLKLDPKYTRISAVLPGSMLEFYGYSFFQFQDHTFNRAFTGMGAGMGVAPQTNWEPGAEQHFSTVFVDILESTPPGTRIPIELGEFGEPPIKVRFHDEETFALETESEDGWILVGDSPLAEVANVQAEQESVPVNKTKGIPRFSKAIILSWLNQDDYDRLEIHRDGRLIENIVGSSTSFTDANPGPGIHTYEIIATKDDLISFPTRIKTLPENVPGTFARGDVNQDLVIDLTDAVVGLSHLFLGKKISCPDALDADDNSELEVTDPINILSYLFLGTGELPPPDLQQPWLDPTPDELGCE